MYVINIYNKSTVVTDADCMLMTTACSKQLLMMCNSWNVICPKISFISSKVSSTIVLAPRVWAFVIIDTADVADALAYHQDPDGSIAGYVFAKTILDYGGVILYKDRTTPTVSSALFHELAETIINPNCNMWWFNGTDTYYAGEVCDPVQGDVFPYVVASGKRRINVGLSDYVFPSWSDPVPAIDAKYNYLGTLTAPFTLNASGYAIIFTSSSQEILIFGNTKNMATKNNRFSRVKYLDPVLEKNDL